MAPGQATALSSLVGGTGPDAGNVDPVVSLSSGLVYPASPRLPVDSAWRQPLGLAQSLANSRIIDRRGRETEVSTTNIYIRGLKPNTTDDSLKQMCLDFGHIISAKAIVDHETQQCKGDWKYASDSGQLTPLGMPTRLRICHV
eukprot:m.165190 g.165190  ORF g.165190 m.165190 type:complete len:143 (-) comp10323_c0_seq10:846-1274(-)